MKIIKSIPRGYCHGVVNALNIVSKTVKENDGEDIYILGEIVHNTNVKKAFEKVGVVSLEGGSRAKMIDDISSGIVIVTAHGIDEKLIKKAQDKGLKVIDATCSDVLKTHTIIKDKIKEGYDVVFVGKKNHPEVEGVLGISNLIHLVTNEADLNRLQINNTKIVITNQTTMSKYDTLELFKKAQEKFPQIEIINEICDATSSRQEICLENSQKADLTIVVGDHNSNNTLKLAEIAKEKGNCKTHVIQKLDELNINWLLDLDVETVHVTSGASTPTLITKEIIDFIENFDKQNKKTWDNTSKIDLLRIIPRV